MQKENEIKLKITESQKHMPKLETLRRTILFILINLCYINQKVIYIY